MVYTNDPKAVRDAKKDVDDAKLEIQKQSIQDRIGILDDEISRYDDLIDQINKAADAQIKALEKIKNKWQEVTDQQGYAKNTAILTGEFGTDAIGKILSGNDDDLLARWKDSYISAISAIDMETQGHVGEITKQLEALYRNISDIATVSPDAAPIASTVSGSQADLPDGSVVLADGTVLRPLQPGDKMYDLVQKFDAYLKKIDGNLDMLVPNSFYEHNRQMNEMANQISYVNSITNNNRNMQPIVNHINVTCPGVTSQQVAEQLGSVIGKELDKQFSGFHNWTDQMSRVR